MADRVVSHLDYGVLVATLSAIQGPSAKDDVVRAGVDGRVESAREHSSLIELLVGGPGWREAVVQQAGRFNRRITVTHGKEA